MVFHFETSKGSGSDMRADQARDALILNERLAREGSRESSLRVG